ncbi:hypothetical protein AJ80_01814 [Polytolypa hystricis UAMH7299]|uniref:Uncharacterized protein n=1 Tax=Polytolypa hystricis (strain UAMH7299) TaxID=1447883 RepID=A0A2B7YZC4_POLH7|nr:hypothetical protein AJ80_01814 [Polytolypa hystricis UAMH7299]
MPSHLVLPSRFLCREDVQLACLVPNIKEPELDAFESPVPLRPTDFTVNTIEDYHAFLQSRTDSRARAMLTRLARLTSETINSTDVQVAAQSARIYTLRKPAQLFGTLCKESNVREWLKEQVEDDMDVYFVIGLDTLIDSSNAEGAQLKSRQSAQVAVPIGEIVGATPMGDYLDVGLEGGRGKNQETSYRYLAPGERICTLRLKKVIFRFWQPRDAANASLSKNSVWRTVSSNRGASEQKLDHNSELCESWLEGLNAEDGDTSDFDVDDESVIFHLDKLEEADD